MHDNSGEDVLLEGQESEEDVSRGGAGVGMEVNRGWRLRRSEAGARTLRGCLESEGCT